MTEKFGSGRFCCRSCANSHNQTTEQNQKRRVKVKINSEKRSELNKERYLENPKHCPVCGKVLPYEKRFRKVCCNNCHNELLREQKLALCATQGTNLCGKGLRGYYKGYYCQSSWELAYVIYNLDHNVVFERNKKGFKYVLDGVERSYFPDFYLPDSDTYVEIKGYYDRKTKEKEKQFIGNLIVYKLDMMKPILDYVIETYGKDFVKLYD